MMTVVAGAVTARAVLRRVHCLMAMALVPSMTLLIPAAAAAFLRLSLMPAVFAMLMRTGFVPLPLVALRVMLISSVVMMAVAG
jgi:hypothetical protein